MATLEHNFDTAFGVLDINGIQGYMQCMNAVYKHIEETTNFDPAKRMIDSVPLLDKIAATNAEFTKLLNNELKTIKEK